MKAGLGAQALEMGHERQNRLIVPKSEVLTWSIVDARQGGREPCLAPDLEEGPVKRDSNEKGEKVGSPAQKGRTDPTPKWRYRHFELTTTPPVRPTFRKNLHLVGWGSTGLFSTEYVPHPGGAL